VVADAPPPPLTTPTATPKTLFVEVNLIYYYDLFIYHYVDCDNALPRCRHRRSIRAAAFALPPLHCALPPRFALAAAADAAAATAAVPPPSFRRRRAVTLPPPPLSRCCAAATANIALSRCRRRRQAAADIALSRCRHRCSLRAAATGLLPLRCALPPLPLPPPPPRRRQATADVALLRCRHRRSFHAAATASPTALPPLPLPPPLLGANLVIHHCVSQTLLLEFW
jgi:hypothetical protein